MMVILAWNVRGLGHPDKNEAIDLEGIQELIPISISPEVNSSLSKEVFDDEIKKAVFDMGGLKSPGPDGFSGILDHSMNKTNIVLIPKIKNPTEVITKILASRLKEFLPDIIPTSQSAFVNGRLIHDNIILAHEAFHAMKKKRRGSEGIMALKIDFEKAYDKVDWKVLHVIMSKMCFCEWWINRVMICISTVSFALVINGERQGDFTPGRGLRQGDPLSPFLFLFVSNVFSWLVERELTNGDLQGFRIGRRCPVLSHLLFADDCVIFSKVSEAECDSIKRILNGFQLFTGQAINCKKSSIFFSPNTSGYHSSKVKRKLQGWKTNLLSQAGKEILIKSVATAIPTYVMQCFCLPVTFCDEIASAIAKFWWNGSQDKERGIHWLSWDKLCKSKKFGGMGFRDLRSFNLALVAKQAWRILKNPQPLLARVLKGLYFPSGNIFLAQKGHNPSWAWSSIHEGLKLIEEGSIWRVGNGKGISIWEDKWIPSSPDHEVSSPIPDNCHLYRVANLLDPNQRQWSHYKLSNLFNPSEINAISSIPIGGPNVKDELIWPYSKNREYSVKSGYHLSFSSKQVPPPTSSSNDVNSDQDLWDSIWSINTPPKIRAFIWKACHNIVPTRGTLFSRFHGKFTSGSSCPRCGECYESLEHVIFFCPFAQAVWKISDFGYSPNHRGFPGFAKWWKKLSMLNNKGLFSNGLDLIAFLCWSIWKARNALVFSASSESPLVIWNRANSEYQEFSASVSASVSSNASSFSSSTTALARSWIPPRPDFLKVNCDAAYCDLFGHFFFALNTGWNKVILESDNMGVISRINSKSFSAWESAAVEEDIVSLTAFFPLFSFCFVSRSCNTVADWVAKACIKGICPLDWQVNPPPMLRRLLAVS
ncbi:hypothetical protein GQ457_18G015470 [Hibiscus cannabinus]